MIAPVAARLADGRRLHFQHGPIDLVLEVVADPAVAERAEADAWRRFTTVLDELVPQLRALRTPVTEGASVDGRIARRMLDAAARFADVYVTPMAAVAGSVAEEILDVITAVPGVRRSYVNNGGDIALHLAPGETLSVGLATSVTGDEPELRGRVDAGSGVGGLATSGWRGRSFSLGAADSVTVFGRSASVADVAATLVANAVDLPGHPAIERVPATELDPESDLRGLLVTVDVGPLSDGEVALALDRGQAEAERLLARVHHLCGAVLVLGADRRHVGQTPPLQELPCAC